MELDPAMAEPLTVLASLNETSGDWVEADRLYEKALALDPEDPTSQFWHAIMLSRAGYWWRLDAICACLAVDPTNGALHRCSECSRAQGQFESARGGGQGRGTGLRSFRGSCSRPDPSGAGDRQGQSRAGTGISSGAIGLRPHSSWSRQWLIRAGALALRPPTICHRMSSYSTRASFSATLIDSPLP
jgi:hypothetical protein